TTVAGRDGHEIQMKSGNTFRMKLDGSRIEHFTHGQVNPFGMIIDEFGDHFTADCHTKPVALLLQSGYYDSFGKPHDGLGYVPDVMDHLHGSTAIGGLAQVHDSNWPPEFQGNTFGGNVMTSRVNRNSLHRTGSTVRAQQEPDFLLSGDPWFRPVDLQFGPDGALYVADFYNRIIGHYEVDLKHPGRDRTSGRIWRISYGSKKTALPDLNGKSARQLVRLFKSSNLALRKLAEDRLADRMGNRAIVAATDGLKDKDPNVRIHSLWVLQRLDRACKLTSDPNDRVRTHAVRTGQAVETTGEEGPPTSIVWSLRTSLLDESPMVTRAAAMSATVHRDKSLIRPLLIALRHADAKDVHLRHALRMALRDHLKNKDWFQETIASVEQQDVPVLAGICLALRTEHAGEFLARNLNRVPAKDTAEFTKYLKAAARYVPIDSADLVVEAASNRFAKDTNLQLELLRSIDSGFAERGIDRPDSVTAWATALADKLLNLEAGDLGEVISWNFIPATGGATTANPWQVSTRRSSQDGQQNSRLYSSIPTGEQQVGTYRTGTFKLPANLRFWMAGHGGFPAKPHQRKNYVRLRDASSHAIVQTWLPPRNDTAQEFKLQSTEMTGKRVYIELVDGDSANAYAWLAAGRFSVAGLNPTTQSVDRTKGIRLIADMRLTTRRSALVRVLEQSGTNKPTANLAVESLANLDGQTQLRALAAAMAVSGIDTSLREKSRNAVVAGNADALAALLPSAMQVASRQEQLKLATILAESQSTAALLVDLCERGTASPQLLAQPLLKTKLTASAGQSLASRVEALIADLPPEDDKLNALIKTRSQIFLARPGNPIAGAKLFTKHCAACHQVAGKGAKVGPNLDGIGTRGLGRLMEDVLAPNRNVDVNFRATTILTEDGRVLSGLLKPSSGAVTVVVDSEGKEVSIPTASIEEKKSSRLSPMPSNVAEKLSSAEFSDLMAYLLSLGG
ncbi:MAG: c-type cytochrome, partial [Planctomycetaceae bacterium]